MVLLIQKVTFMKSIDSIHVMVNIMAFYRNHGIIRNNKSAKFRLHR